MAEPAPPADRSDPAGEDDPGRTFRRYLQVRVSMEEPDLVLRGMERREARRLARRLGHLGVLRRRTPGSERGGPDGESGPDGQSRPGGQSAPEPARGDEPSLSEEGIERLSRVATAEEIGEIPDLVSLRRVAESCVRCPLHEGRKQVVFGEGDPGASVMCVGEAPGAREDETGRPFVGPAGKLLDRLLLSVGFSREEVYICNVLKSRPPNNRDPREEEIEACSPYLHRQIELVEPRVIVAFGTFASRTLLDARETLSRLRGRTHLYRGVPLVATYHPAALLRNRSWTRPTWEDLQLVRRIVDGEAGSEATEQLDLV